MKVLAICGSIRAREANQDLILELAHTKGDIPEFIENARRLVSQDPGLLSNSEILAAAGMRGALQQGAQVEYLSLPALFEKKEAPVFDLNFPEEIESFAYLDTLSIPEASLNRLLNAVEEAGGVLLCTPVYFGDRSSVANKLLQVTARWNLLKNKVFGVASVGAKRNGGQETSNVYSMIEALNQGALVVGNGPPTSQYGGTAVAGHKGRVLEDAWGLQTAQGTGAKVAHVSHLVETGREAAPHEPVTISVLVTMDTDARFLADHLRGLTQSVQEKMPHVTFEIHEVIEATIFRCLGCNTCPRVSAEESRLPKCAIKDPEDYLEGLRDSLHQSQAAIVAGLNTLDVPKMIFRYQVLTERMRYLRRNDFELTDLLMAGLCYQQFGATVNSIHSIKVLTSYIRQNTTFHRPVEILEYDGLLLEDGQKTLLDFCRMAQVMKKGRSIVAPPVTRYETGGLAGGYG